MLEPLAYLNGRLIPASHLSVPPTDAGFVLGITVAEQMRTFGGKLFRWAEHFERFQQSLATVGTGLEFDEETLRLAAERLIRNNHRHLAEGDDLGLAMFATPGTYSTFTAAGDSAQPLLAMHTYPLPFHLWAAKFSEGQALCTTEVQQVPAECWPPELKCRSRMHYYLADRAAASRHPGARAVMLDRDGFVTEASTANLVICRDNRIVSPPVEKVLPGISIHTLAELAEKADLEWEHADLRPEDLTGASEVLLTSTSICVLPVTRFNGQPVGDGQPGPIYRKLAELWNQLVGLDIAQQARQFAGRGIPVSPE